MSEFEIITLNIWGLLAVSAKRRERVQHLGTFLRSTTADAVLLQEVWVEADARHLIQQAYASGLQYSMHFKSGMFGSGLVTLSRYPIVECGFWRYAASGDAAAVTCGDFYAGKGVGWARVATSAGYLDLFNTHLHANYSHKYNSKAAARRGGADGSVAGASSGGAASGTGNSKHSGAGDKHAAGGGGGANAAATRGGRPQPVAVPASREDHLPFRVPQDQFAAFRVAQMLDLTSFISLCSRAPFRHPGAVLNTSASPSGPAIPCGGVAAVASPGFLGGEAVVVGSSSLAAAGSAPCLGVVLAGDLNSKPDTLEMQVLATLLPQLRDAWAAMHGDEAGYTCKAPTNSFQPRRQVPERIDYVLSTLPATRCDITLTHTPAGFSYSDHFAVRARLRLQLAHPQAQPGSLAEGLLSPGKAPLPLSLMLPPQHSSGSGGTLQASALMGAPGVKANAMLALESPGSARAQHGAAAMAGQGSAGLGPAALTSWAGWLPGGASAASDEAVAVFRAAEEVLRRGVTLQASHAWARMAMAVICANVAILLALLSGAVNLSSAQHSAQQDGAQAAGLDVAGTLGTLPGWAHVVLVLVLLPVATLLAAGFAVIVFAMGQIADQTQARVLRQALSQLAVVARGHGVEVQEHALLR